MVWATALALFAQAASQSPPPPPWALPWPDEPLAWAGVTADRDQFYVRESEVQKDSISGGVTFWMHGQHSANKSVPYRRSMWRLRLDCQGGMSFLASSTFDAAGKQIQAWDGSDHSAVRPDTIYQDLQRVLCKR
jgi:hypothetical protein